MIRPPARDVPPPEETAELVASLRTSVQNASRRAGSMVVRSADRARGVRIVIEDARSTLTLEEHGLVLAEREVDTVEVLALLEGGGRFAALAAFLDEVTDE